MTAGETSKSKGREHAIEALLDLDPRSPQFRFSKILKDGLHAALDRRPNLISHSALLDAANLLSEYELSVPSRCSDLEFYTDSEQSTSSTLESPNIPGNQKCTRERITRHQEKIFHAKVKTNTECQSEVDSNANDSTPLWEKDRISMIPKLPSQLIATLRKIYGTHSVETSSAVLDHSQLLQYLSNHPIFSSPKEKGRDSKDCLKDDQDIDCLNQDEVDPLLSLANIELIVARACFLHSSYVEGCGGPVSFDDVLTGYLIAAWSVFTICLGNESRTDSPPPFLQVGGPLSLISEFRETSTINYHNYSQEFTIDRDLLRYYRETVTRLETQHQDERKYVSDNSSKGEVTEAANIHAQSEDLGNECVDGPASSSEDPGHNENIAMDSGSDVDDHDGDDAMDSETGGQHRIFLSAQSAFQDDDVFEDEEDEDDEENDDDDVEDDSMEDQSENPDEHQDDSTILERALALSLEQIPNSENIVCENNVARGADTNADANNMIIDVDGGQMKSVEGEYPDRTKQEKLADESVLEVSQLLSIPTYPYERENYPLVSGNDLMTIDSNLNPVSLADFGKLPSARILIHLLDFVHGLANEKCLSYSPRDDVYFARCTGGVASSLFPCKRKHVLSLMKERVGLGDVEPPSILTNEAQPTLERKYFWMDSMALQLYVLIVKLFANERRARIIELDVILDTFSNNSVSEENTDGLEMDDPAFASLAGLVSSSIQHTTFLSPSESLEEKGLIRKAAAAAHSASLKKENNMKKISLLRQQIRLFSMCSLLALRSSRQYILHKSIEAMCSLESKEGKNCPRNHDTILGNLLITPLTRMKLSATLASFVSSEESEWYHRIVQKASSESNDTSDVANCDFLLCSLFQEGIHMWGECVPLMYPSQSEIKRKLDQLIEYCKSSFVVTSHRPDALHEGKNASQSSMPWSKEHEHIMKLQAICIRLRRSDILSQIVPRAIKYQSTEDEGSRTDWHASSVSFDRVSSYMTSICKALVVFRSDSRYDTLLMLYRALCHRCTCNWLLWESCYDDGKISSDDYSTHGSPSGLAKLVPSIAIDFDPLKCPDSVALTPSKSPIGNSANQRANKVWGTVLSVQGFSPKSGIHRWAVELNQCERGHVFVGVVTSQASIKTYIGGDKYGWGFIGTQALWHDRRKIRTDYGGVLRSGAVVIVTLDTNIGTIRFGLWNKSTQSVHDDHRSSSFWDVGTVTDWGVAFEGLPLDSRFFPAVGLYQRDDKVTLMKVESMTENGDADVRMSKDLSPYENFYPLLNVDSASLSSALERTRHWNSTLCDHSISYVTAILGEAIRVLESRESFSCRFDCIMLKQIIPSILSSLCLLPSNIPVLSCKVAFELLPTVLRWAESLSRKIKNESHTLTTGTSIQLGKWIVRLTSTMGQGLHISQRLELYDEYHVELKQCSGSQQSGISIQGLGIGLKGRVAERSVSITGTVRGTLLHFIESWTEDKGGKQFIPTSFIEARLSLDGTMLEGTCFGFNGEAVGTIAGICIPDQILPSMFNVELFPGRELFCDNSVISQVCTLSSMAVTRLCIIISGGTGMDDFDRSTSPELSMDRKRELTQLIVTSGFLSGGISEFDPSWVSKMLMMFSSVEKRQHLIAPGSATPVVSKLIEYIGSLSHGVDSSPNLIASFNRFDDVDKLLAAKAGGYGSLRSLDPTRYDLARKSVISVLLRHKGIVLESLSEYKMNEDVVNIWRTALLIVENSVRKALSVVNPGFSFKTACQVHCDLLISLSTFLFRLFPSGEVVSLGSAQVEEFFLSISNYQDLLYVERKMFSLSGQALLRTYCLQSIRHLLRAFSGISFLEEIALLAVSEILGKAGHSKTGQVVTTGDISYIGGSCSHIQRFIVSTLTDIYSILGNTSSTKWMECLREGYVSCYSRTSAVLAVFFVNMQGREFYKDLAATGDVWSVLNSLLTSLKPSLNTIKVTGSDTIENLLLASENRFASLNLVRIAIFSMHSLLYRCCLCQESAEIVTPAVTLMKTEIISAMKEVSRDHLDLQRQKAFTDIQRHLEQLQVTAAGLCRQEKRNTNREFFQSPQQTILSLFESSYAAVQSQMPGHENVEFIPSTLDSKANYLTLLLNLFSSMILSASVSVISLIDYSWIEKVITCIFCKETGQCKGLPSSIAVRILRLMRLLLPTLIPQVSIIEQLLRFIGSHQTILQSVHDEKPQISCEYDTYLQLQESISLLRSLYGRASHSWRQCLNAVIEEKCCNNDNNRIFQLGVLAFIGGLPDKLSIGSFVRLKPTCSSLSTSVTRYSCSSSSNALLSCSPIVIGSGLETLVASFHRFDSLAGMISSFDTAIGSCEIVLFESYYENDNVASFYKNGKMNVSCSSSIAVRALRAPVSDVLLAQEIAFVPGPDTPMKWIPPGDFFRNNSPLSDSSCKAELAFDLQLMLLTLRSMYVLFSHETTLSRLIVSPINSSVLKRVLSIAAGEVFTKNFPKVTDVVNDHIGLLPEYETHYWLVRLMFSDLMGRQRALDFDCSKWIEEIDQIPVHSHIGTATAVEGNVGKENSSVSGLLLSTSLPNSDGLVRGDSETRFQRLLSMRINESDSTNESARIEDDELAIAHLREVAILQMAELGLPRAWSDYALRRVGGVNIEAAVHFCLEHAGEIERLVAEEHDRRESSNSSSSATRRSVSASRGAVPSHLLRQLVEMGFPSHWCTEALANSRSNLDDALSWILTNGERLSALDDGNDDVDEDDAEDTDNVSTSVLGNGDSIGNRVADHLPDVNLGSVETSCTRVLHGWKLKTLLPVCSISGKCIIEPESLEVSGSSDGGFSSVGMKGVLLTSGKWYYEVELITAGCIQVGWADASFSGQCSADRGEGCGDGTSSWAFDGWRRYRWHKSATAWGCKWREGDIVGCLLDLDNKVVSFTLNGRGEEIGMGVAFSGDGFNHCGGVYACISFNRKERVRLLLGETGVASFHYKPPSEYRGVGESVLVSTSDRDALVLEERVINNQVSSHNTEIAADFRNEPFLCDFSDEEQGFELFAWQHRYFGADALIRLNTQRKDNDYRDIRQRSISRASGSTTALLDDLSYTRLNFIMSHHIETVVESIRDSRSNRNTEKIQQQLRIMYADAADNLCEVYINATVALLIMHAKKVVMQVPIVMSSKFRLDLFIPHFSSDDIEYEVAIQLWRVIERHCSLYAFGWSNDSALMIMTAEAISVGVTGSDYHDIQLKLLRSRDFFGDQNKVGEVPLGASSQVLTSVQNRMSLFDASDTTVSSSSSYAACSETVAGGDPGCFTIFLRTALENALLHSHTFVRMILAVIRRSVRMLSLVEYPADDSLLQGDKSVVTDENILSSKNETAHVDPFCVDPRLASFLTGLLLSAPAHSIRHLDHTDVSNIPINLCEAWSVGLLSASIPLKIISAWTVAGIIDIAPQVLQFSKLRIATLRSYYERLESKIIRRIWAERCSAPIFSHYLQSMIELFTSVRYAEREYEGHSEEVIHSTSSADSCLPSSLNKDSNTHELANHWEWRDGWIGSDDGWEVWVGTIEYFAVDWLTPPRSAVRSLMDSGEGPPMLREGCTVIRGLDWAEKGSGAITGNEDGKDTYEREKFTKEKISDDDTNPAVSDTSDSQPEYSCDGVSYSNNNTKKRKAYSPVLPIGKVISIEPWNGMAGLGRRIRWVRTGEEGIYRYGGDGGRFDVSHVELNKKGSRIIKRYPLPESAEQIAARCGFGQNKRYNVLLRVKKTINFFNTDLKEGEIKNQAILEWPDFGASIKIDCRFHKDGAITMTELGLIHGSKDSGWEARFGKPSYEAGTTIVLRPMKDTVRQVEGSFDASVYESLFGRTSYIVDNIRNRADGNALQVSCEMHFVRGRSSSDWPYKMPRMLPPIRFDNCFHASSIGISLDGMTATCLTAGGRGTAFGSVGFCKGIHYWEIKIEQAETGSIFIGVAEKPTTINTSTDGSHSENDSPTRLNKWYGWGFVNYRATYSAGIERVYGAHCHAGDTVGILLDCDAGRLSFFVDSVKYGEHNLNDLGCAFENLSPFGFSAEGCGTGGAGRGASNATEIGRSNSQSVSGTVQPKALWPVVGLRHVGDRVTFSGKWMTSHGTDATSFLRNLLAVDDISRFYYRSNDASELETCSNDARSDIDTVSKIPEWLVKESFEEYITWIEGRWIRVVTRGSGPQKFAYNSLNIDVDCSPYACAVACATIGLSFVLLSGDVVKVKRCAGRLLELPEEAIVLGAYQGRLWYRLISQKNEGGSLTEGGDRAWFWNESEVVSDSLEIISPLRETNRKLSVIDRFKCTAGGIRIVYSGGAVMRSDLEIFDGSTTLGIIPCGAIIPRLEIKECRVNSCGVTRFRVTFATLGEGWISARIRGGKEEPIVEIFHEESVQAEMETSCATPEDAAMIWLKECSGASGTSVSTAIESRIGNYIDFAQFLQTGILPGMSAVESDSLLSSLLSSVAEFTSDGNVFNCSFHVIASAIQSTLNKKYSDSQSTDYEFKEFSISDLTTMTQTIDSLLARCSGKFPQVNSLMARMSLLRVINRRAQYALPALSMRPTQEGRSVLGGSTGFGASVVPFVNQIESWVRPSSIGARIRFCRRILFTQVKKVLFDSIIEVTTSATALSHDEYELPRDIRTIRINRMKARTASLCNDVVLKTKYSVFSQLYNELRSWTGSALRRSFVAKGHGGQKRAFKVKLIGEGVNDYSGPYREIFADAIREVFDTDEDGYGYSGIMMRSPNAMADVGEHRNLFVFNGLNFSSHYSRLIDWPVSMEERLIRKNYLTYLGTRNESSKETEDRIFFLGLLCGLAVRHNIQLDIPLPLNAVWKVMCKEPVSERDCLAEIDFLALRQLENNHERSIEISSLIVSQQRLLNTFIEGLAVVLPVEIFSLFTGEELQNIFCGHKDIDLTLLRSVTEYEGYHEGDDDIKNFWDVLTAFSTPERKLFLQFVWSRSRLPAKKSDFDTTFKIQRDTKTSGNNTASLPSASTCFFTLTLPSYGDKETLRDKLCFAINNVTTMESDYVTNDAEVGEGWRGL